jgi:ligand-binding sensor domain-containing protein
MNLAATLKRNWPMILVGLAVAASAFVSLRKPPVEKPAPIPAGWAVIPEAGSTLALAIDGDVVWAGSKDGLHKIDRKTGSYIGRAPVGNRATLVRSVVVDLNGAVWVAHANGLTRLLGETTTTLDTGGGLPSNRVNALLLEGNEMLVGTAKGLVVVTNLGGARPTVKASPLTSRLAAPIVNVMMRDKAGGLWVGSSSTPTGGLAYLFGDQTKRFFVRDGLPHPYVHSLVQLPDGDLWVASGLFDKGGAARIRGGKVVEVLHKSDGLAGEKARSVGLDADGDLWIGSEMDGLAIRHGGKLIVLTKTNGLPHNEITRIQTDKDGNVWLATMAGVVRLDRNAVENAKRR